MMSIRTEGPHDKARAWKVNPDKHVRQLIFHGDDIGTSSGLTYTKLEL